MKPYKLIIAFFFLFFTGNSYGQFSRISGRATDIFGNPIPRATISFKGSLPYQTMTDEDGKYETIRNNLSDTILICRHVNFKTLETKIQGSNLINIQLYPKQKEYILPIIYDSTNTPVDSTNLVKEQSTIDSFIKLNKNKIFTLVEGDPEFPGGQTALKMYFQKQISKTKLKIDHSIKGTITINFIIQKDGSLKDIILVKGIQSDIDKMIMRITKTLPQWRPALQNGKYCDYNYSLSVPISYKVLNEKNGR